jgi:hypothetical protein
LAAHLTQQDERVPATGATGTAGTRARACGGSLAFDGRVDAGLDSRLQLLDIAQLRIAGSRGWRLFSRRITICGLGKELFAEQQITAAAKGQLLTIAHGDCDSPGGAGDNVLTGEDPVAFNQRSARSIGSYCKDFADNLTDDTN